MALPMAAVLPGEHLLSCGIIHGQMLPSAPAWIYPQALMCQYPPAAAAQPYPWASIPSEVPAAALPQPLPDCPD